MADEKENDNSETVSQPEKYLQLRNAEGSFVDPETQFRLVADRIAQCPSLGALTGAWIRSGAIIEVSVSDFESQNKPKKK